MQPPIIYLDNNATTKIDARVLEAMYPFLTEQYANASSTHLFGLQTHEAVKSARSRVAAFIAIRFSLGKFNTKEEMDRVIDAVKKVVMI